MRRAALLVLVLVAAGCGGGGKAPSVAGGGVTTTSRTTAQSSSKPADVDTALLAYAKCMRANGVPAFPDPSSEGGFTFRAGGGVDPGSPAFRAAQQKCAKLMPLGGLSPGTTTHPTSQWLAQMIKAAQCMRAHGVPNFPDPTTTVPQLDPAAGGGIISDIDGAVFVFPHAIDTQSPAFIRGAKACGFPLHNH